MNKTLPVVILTLLLTGCLPKPATDYLNESEKDFNKRMEWWRDAGFGMFIHWGLYAVPAGVYKGEARYAEWIMNQAGIPKEEYEQYAEVFNPVKFNANEWVKIAENAGMKYIVITSKHHDGFCMWDSEITDYDIIDRTPFKRDVLKELSVACEKAGIRLCFYHSIMDWHHPDATGENFSKYREEYMIPQLKELVTDYGDLGVLWFDGEWIEEWTEDQGRELYNYLRGLKPDLIINNRVGKGRSGMQGMSKYEDAVGDFGTPEQEILEGTSSLDWESCMTMNGRWGYVSYDKNFKSTQTLIHNLIDIAAKGGNYLLNVGPTAEGLIPGESVQRLEEMGQWMTVNGEIIHNSRSVKNYRESEFLYYLTDKKAKIYYAITTTWPGVSLNIKYILPKKGSKIKMLGYPEPLEWKNMGPEGIEILIPEALQEVSGRPCQHAWVFKISGKEVEVVEKPEISAAEMKNIKKVLFSDHIIARLSTNTAGATIHFTLDGSLPTISSPVYNGPVDIRESALIRTIAVKKGSVSSHPAETEFLKVTSFKSITFSSPFSEKYSAHGPLTLGNGIIGGEDFSDMEWLGWEGEDFEALVDLGQTTDISRLSAGFLNSVSSWIFLPGRVEFFISENGENFISAGIVQNDIPLNTDKKFRKDFSVLFEGKARFIKIFAENIKVCPEWHQGAGGKAWLFVDEIIIE